MNLILFKEEELSCPLPLDDFRAVHILSVLKTRPGEAVRAGIINGRRGWATLKTQSPTALHFLFAWDDFPPPSLPLTLLIGVPRPPVAQRLLRDLTTLGVHTILFVGSALSEKSYLHSRIWDPEAVERSLILGAQQGETTFLPTVERFPSLFSALSSLSESGARYLLDLKGGLANTISPASSLVLAVGSERGWTSTEKGLLVETNFLSLSLGPRIIRTETACAMGIALLVGALTIAH